MYIYTLAKEKFVKLFHIITCSKHALVIPEVVKVITANPIMHVLMIIIKVDLETIARWETSLKLLFSDEGVSKDFELIFLFLEQVL